MENLLLDGSVLEGGGQLLRNAIAFSTLLSKPITIQNVRSGRVPPGLRNQHAAGINLAAQICGATLKGAKTGSSTVEYNPGSVQVPGNYIADPGTAGSTTLLLQVSLPCLLFSASPQPPAPSTRLSSLTLKGGTNALQAPQIDYCEHVLLPFLRRHFGLHIGLQLERRGYYPRGGGCVVCSVPAIDGPLPAVTLVERGELRAVRGTIHVGGLPDVIAFRMLQGARDRLVAGGIDRRVISIDARREPDAFVVGHGGSAMLWAETSEGCIFGGSAVSSRGVKPENVGNAAAEALLKGLEEGGCVDEYLQDQMIVFLALAKGKSTVLTGPLTLHTRTAIWVAEQLTDAKFTTAEDSAGRVLITCEGIGYSSPISENSKSPAET